MKVKELIEKLLKCDQELEVAYEHCYIDYVQERQCEGIVETGGLRSLGYTRWIPVSKRKPEEGDFPCIVAWNLPEGWSYFLLNSADLFKYTDDKVKTDGYWMPLQRTPEDFEQLLKGNKNGQ